MRHRTSTVALAGLLLAPLSSIVQAQVVDQANYAPSLGSTFAYFWLGQTFRPSANTSVGGGLLLATQPAVTGVFTAQLWSDVPSNTGATLLAAGSTPFNLGVNQQVMMDAFWSPVAVTPGAQYFLAMVVSQNNDLIYTGLADQSTYASGSAWFGSGLPIPTNWAQSTAYDLIFEEFSSSTVVVTTPEPASLALVATGLVGLFGATRRRGRKIG